MKRIVLVVFCFLFLASCSKEILYDLEVSNSTYYRIDKLRFGCAISETDISLEKWSKVRISVIYNQNFGRFLTEPLFCYDLMEYSDSVKSYKNKYGRMFSISDLRHEKLNKLKIQLDTGLHYEGDIFEIKVNE